MLSNIAAYIQNNNSKCSFHVFLHKAESDVFNEETRQDMIVKTRTQTLEVLQTSGIKIKSINFYLTTIYDNSIFEAVSQVIMKVLPCSQSLCWLLDELCMV
jgi:Ras-related GTP-binding protein C/D